jgi:hypothetical protein
MGETITVHPERQMFESLEGKKTLFRMLKRFFVESIFLISENFQVFQCNPFSNFKKILHNVPLLNLGSRQIWMNFIFGDFSMKLGTSVDGHEAQGQGPGAQPCQLTILKNSWRKQISGKLE